MTKKYKTAEHKRNSKKATYMIIAAIALFIAFVFWGLPLIARFSTFIANFRNGSKPVEISDQTPPAPPFLFDVPEFTNKSSIKIEGKTEEGATVRIFMNSSEDEVLADKDGEFQFTFSLKSGDNTLSALSIDAAGNESQETKEYPITNDTDEPEIVILSPEDGHSFYGSQERQITIEGTTEEKSEVTINERVIVVGSEGTFTFTTSLSDGENVFEIKSKDRASNESETTLTVSYSS